ncbi:multidrug resistance protein [Candida albicans P60002]|nr:multidrug resistance protein [Candida albicans P94015]KHC45661.1 multidrug resistance protein [Candida albicans P60002]
MPASGSISSEEPLMTLKPYEGIPTIEGDEQYLQNYSTAQAGENELLRIESNVQASKALSRIISDSDPVLQRSLLLNEPLPLMGGGRPYPPLLGSRDPYVVTFDGPDDAGFPQNFPFWKKMVYSLGPLFTALSVSLGSAMFSQASPEIMAIYHIGVTPAALTTALFVFGFASGPVIYGPLSELFGRKIIMVISSFLYVCFSFAVATANDIQTIMICRFFSGFVGSATFVVSPAIFSDLFSTKQRGTAISTFAGVLFGGPMLAPIFGGFTVKNSSLGWRWTSYFCGIVACLGLVLNVFLLDETHHPIILVKRAEELRRRTGNWGIYAPHEELTLSLKEIVENNIARPLKMLFTESILFLVSIYNGFIYAMLYCLLTAMPLIFQEGYGFRRGVAELPYLAMLLGVFIGIAALILFEQRYLKAMEKNNGKPIPEERLPPVFIGGIFFIIGIVILTVAGDFPKKVHFMVPTVGAGFVGFALMLIFLPTMNYVIDCYLFVAASALAANTFLRSAMAAVFPLFSHQMFVNLTNKYAGTILAGLGVLLLPVPIAFRVYGKKIRENSKYAYK